MAQFADEAGPPKLPHHPELESVEMLRGLLKGPNVEYAADIRSDLQKHMFDLCGVVRSEAGLGQLQGILAGLRERYKLIGVHDRGRTFNTELMEAVELGFLLDVSDAVVAAARTRDESRGGHYREDSPLRDDDRWLVHSLAYREDDGSVRLEYKNVKLGPYVPMERKY
jgi:succinate dehydrogenase / fumarate reductase flavoprotein subunit